MVGQGLFCLSVMVMSAIWLVSARPVILTWSTEEPGVKPGGVTTGQEMRS